MVRVSIDTAFYKIELLRMPVHLLRTIELRALEIFKAVVDCGGVTRAAAQLHRVPSNITTRLKQLEEGLGTKLFHRHSRKLLLSTEGKLLLPYAERLLLATYGSCPRQSSVVMSTGVARRDTPKGRFDPTAADRCYSICTNVPIGQDSKIFCASCSDPTRIHPWLAGCPGLTP
jgi:hypothetical protein